MMRKELKINKINGIISLISQPNMGSVFTDKYILLVHNFLKISYKLLNMTRCKRIKDCSSAI